MIEKTLEIRIEVKKAGDDPPIDIYHVELSVPSGIWTETFGSKEQLKAFMRGLEAASGMTGFKLVELKDSAANIGIEG